ncbi:MAG TPA: hypothetical protein VNC78_11795 [Actinomycetota bacterium]|nr:hypothetical protein [Actinomycetota bacterium]
MPDVLGPLRLAAVRALIVVTIIGVVIPGTARHRAVAAPAGTIEGRVINAVTGRSQRGVVVTLSTAGPDEGARTVAEITTGRDGHYRFDDLPTGESFYALDARFDGGVFAGSPVSLPADTKRKPVIESTLKVWPTTTDPSVIEVKRNDLFLLQGDGGIGVIESVTFINLSDHAYIGRGGSQSLGFSLPRGATADGVTILESDLDVPVVVPADFGFATTVAIPPGERHITFTYSLRGTAGNFDASRTMLYPTSSFTVFAAEPLELGSNRLVAGGTRVIDSKNYNVHRSEDPIAAGDAVQITAVAEAGRAPMLVGGSIALIILLAGAGMVAGRARRTADPSRREQLLRTAAELDIRHARGEISDDDYEHRRRDVTAHIGRISDPDPGT